MKQDQKQKKKYRPDTPATVLKAKPVAGDKGNVLRQYPADTGFHGTGKESELSPEE